MHQALLTTPCCTAGIYNDLGSGSNVDLCIITKGKVDYKRNVELLMGKTYSRQKPVRYAPGTARKGVSPAKSSLLRPSNAKLTYLWYHSYLQACISIHVVAHEISLLLLAHMSHK